MYPEIKHVKQSKQLWPIKVIYIPLTREKQAQETSGSEN